MGRDLRIYQTVTQSGLRKPRTAASRKCRNTGVFDRSVENFSQAQAPEETGRRSLCPSSSQLPPPFSDPTLLTLLFPLVSATPPMPHPTPPHPWWLQRVGAVPGPVSLFNFLGNVGSLPRGAGFLLFSRRCPGSLGFGIGILVLRLSCLETHIQSLWALAQAGPLLECLSTHSHQALGGPLQARGSSALPSCRCLTSQPHCLSGVHMQAQGG